jgi:fibronectin-binding autotransporter adhesin
MCGALAAGLASSRAATYYWDADGNPLINATNNFAIGGTGAWDTSSPFWWDAAAANLAWPNAFGDTAVFGGNAGLVTLSSGVQVGNLVFNTAGYNITALGAGGLTLGDSATRDSGHIQVDVSGTTTISAPIAGTAGLTLSSTTTGTLALAGANTFSGGFNIASGTLSVSRDVNLGAAANGIGFTGPAGNLNVTGPMAMNRDLALGDATVTLTPVGNFSDTGALSGSSSSLLKIVGSSMTSLNNSANFAGTIWEQTGTLSLGAVRDAAGDGNIQLGSGGSAATLLFGNGAYGPVTLNNRRIELMGTTGSATIENSSSIATNGVTINSDLMITGAGLKTLTLTGVNAGTNTFAGAITDGSSPINVTKTGTDLWVLSNAANTYTGTTLVNQGTLRVTGGGGGMGSGSSTFTFGGSNGELLELRNDSSDTYRGMSANAANNSLFAGIFADRAVGGAGTGQQVTFASIVQKNSTAQLGLQADHGYGITINELAAAGGNFTLTLNNMIGAPGYQAPGYTPGIVTINSIVTNAVAGLATYNLSGFGEYALANFTGETTTPLSLIKNGIGFANISGDNSNWNGTYTNSAGTTRVSLQGGNATAIFGSATVTLTGGLLEMRTDASVDFTGRNLTHGNGTLVFAPEIGNSTTDKTLTLPTVPNGAGTLFFDTNHRYNVNFTGAPTITGTTSYNNAGTGLVTFAGLSGNFTVNFNGFGNVNLIGEVTSATITNLGKSSQGVLTLSGTNTIGTVNFTGGVLRVASATALGGTGAITINGNSPTNSGLDFRIDSSADFSNHNMARNYAGIINVDRPADNTTATGNVIAIGGGMTFSDNGWSTAFAGAHGYSLKIGVAGGLATLMGTTAGNIGYVAWNYLPAGSVAEFASGLTFVNTASTTNFAPAGPGDYLFSGPIKFTGGTGSTFAKSGTGVVTLSNSTNNTTFNTDLSIFALSNGVTRVTDGNALGGTLTTVNQSGGLLDLRSDTGLTLLPKITLTNTSIINADQAVGGAGTGGTHTTGDLSASGTNTFTLYVTGDHGYSLKTGNVTLGNTTSTTFVNYMSAGSSLVIPVFTGVGLPVVFSGPGSTFLSAKDDTSNIGVVTKNGSGTLTITAPVNDFGVSNNFSGLVVNAGRLVADYTAAPEFSPQALGSIATLTLGGGTFEMIGSTAANVSQNLGAVTLSAAQSKIVVTPQSGFTTSLHLGSLTATANGSALLVQAPAGSNITFGGGITPNGRAVFTADGSSFDWLATSGDSNNPAAYDGYVPLVTTPAGSDTNHSIVSGSGTLAVARTTNTLKIETNGTGQSLALSGSGVLTLASGGLLFTGADDYTISGLNGTTVGLKSGMSGNADFIVSHYGAGVLTIATPVLDAAGTDTFTKAGPGTVLLGNTATADINKYGGATIVDDGVLKLVNSTRLSGSVNNQLIVNGGTLDLNGNSIGIGNLTGGVSGVVDNTSAGAVTLTIGNNHQGGTFNGTIKNSGGTLSLTKLGTSSVILGDVLTGGSNEFTGDLTLAGTGIVNLATLADAAGSHLTFSATGAGGNLTFLGNTNLTLQNRDIVFTGNGITGTITSTGTIGANGLAGVLTIDSNFTPGASTAIDTLVLAGSSGIVQTPWVNTFGGVIADPAGGQTLLNVTTSGSWQLTGHNTFTGGIKMSGGGSLRFNEPANTNGNTITMVNGTIEFRSDTSQTFNNPINWTTNTAIIIADRAIDGSGYDQVMTLGAIDQNVAGKNIYFRNASWNGNGMTASNVITQYGVHVPAYNMHSGATSQIMNDLGTQGTSTFVQPPATGFGGVPGALTLDQINLTSDVTGVHNLTVSSDGNVGGVTIINGDITQVDGTNSLGLTFSGGGQGFYILANQTAATNFTGGLTITGNNPAYTVVRATTPHSFGPSTNPMTWKRGTVEIRNDQSVNYGHNITLDGTDQFNLYVGEAIDGSGGHNNTFTFGTLTESSVSTGKLLNIFGVAGSANASTDSVVFASAHANTSGLNGSNQGLFGSGIVNNLLLPSTVTIGTGPGSVALTTDLSFGTAFQSFGGAGATLVSGAIMDNATGGKLGINYNASGGYLTLDASADSNYSGGLVIMNGTVRVINQYGLGSPSNVVTMGQASYINSSNTVVAASGNGILEIRSDVDVSYPNPISLLFNGNVYVGQLPGGTNTTGGQDRTIGLGTISTIANSGRTMTFAGVGGSTSNNGYSITTAGIVVDQAATTFTNNLNLPGTLTIASVSNTSTNGTNLVTFGGIGTTTITGPITDGAGAHTQIAFSGSGNSILNLNSPDSIFTGGLTVLGATSSLRVNNTTNVADFTIRPSSQLGGPDNLITLKGTLDFRTDVDVAYPNTYINDGAADAYISADRLVASGAGKTVTLAGSYILTNTQRYLYIGGYNGYNINLAGGYFTQLTNAGTDSRIRNFGSGTVTIGLLRSDSDKNQTFAFDSIVSQSNTTSSNNLTVITGNITQGGLGVVSLNLIGGTLDLTGVNKDIGFATPYSGAVTIGAGTVIVSDGVNFGSGLDAGSLVTMGANTTMQVRADANASFGQTFNIASGVVFDLGSVSGTQTNKLISFGTIQPSSVAGALYTFNARDGYAASIGTFKLNGGAGQTTTLAANAPLTIGSVINQMSGFSASNFDTLVLDGLADGTINAPIADAPGGSIAAGGTTRITKNGVSTWTLGGANATYSGITTINVGTLRLGGNNAIGSSSPVTINATGAGVTTVLDLDGHDQSLLVTATVAALTLSGSTSTSSPQIRLGDGTLTLTNNVAALSFTSGRTATISADGGSGKVVLGTANAIFNVARVSTNIASDTNPYAADVIISAPVIEEAATGGITKLGTGYLALPSTASTMSGALDIQGGVGVGVLPDNNKLLKLGSGTTAGLLEYLGTVPVTFGTRVLTLAGTTGGAALGNSGSGTVTVNTTMSVTGSGNKTFTLFGTNTGDNRFNSLIANVSGTFTVSKLGSGTWTLTADNTYTGSTTVDGGTLRLLNNTIVPSAAGGGYLVANAANSRAALVLENANVTSNIGANAMRVGVGSGAVGVVTQNGGSFLQNAANANNTFVLGGSASTGSGGFGTYNLNGGTVAGAQMEIGNTGSIGILNITDGSFSPTTPVTSSRYVIVSRFGNSIGQVNLIGTGAQTPTLTGGDSSTGLSLGWTDTGSNDRAEITIGHGGVLNAGGLATNGIAMRSNGTNNVGIVNLLSGGTANVGFIGVVSGTMTGVVNLNGGTLRATQNNPAFFGAGITSYIYSGGATLDSNGFNLTIPTPLLAPTGNGIASVGFGDGGDGYITAPYVQITDPTGFGATTIATVDATGKITGVTITNPGVGYTDPTVAFVGGGGSTIPTASATTAANLATGGLIKNGEGSLTLLGDNTFTGGLTINGGSLTLSGDNSSAGDTMINDGRLYLTPSSTYYGTITNMNGVLAIQQPAGDYTVVSYGGLVTASSLTGTFADSGIQPIGSTTNSHGVVALNVTNSGIDSYLGTDVYLGAVGARQYTGATLAAGLDNTYRFGGGAGYNGAGATIGGSGGYLQITSTVATGANQVIIGDDGSYNGGEGLIGGQSTVEFLAPQTFTGTLTLKGGSLVFSNDNQLGAQAARASSLVFGGGILSYAPGNTADVSDRAIIASGAAVAVPAGGTVVFASPLGNVAGSNGGLNKVGAGTLSLTAAETYTGATTVSSGTLKLDFAAAGAPGTDIIKPTTSLVLNGGNLNINGLAASNTVSQSVSSTTFSGALSTITPTFDAAPGTTGLVTLNLGTLNRASGATANIVVGTGSSTPATVAIATSTAGTPNALVTDAHGSAYMTYGTSATAVSDFAVRDNVDGSTIVRAPATGFYTAFAASATVTGDSSTNADLAGSATVAAGGVTLASVRVANTGTHTLTIAAADTLSTGGILVGNTVGNSLTTITGPGKLTGPTDGDLVVHNWNFGWPAGSNQYTLISAIIADNTANTAGVATGVTYSGATNAMIWAQSANTYTGVTTVNGVQLFVATNIQPGVAGQLGNASADPANLILNGGGFVSNSSGTTAVSVNRLFTLGLNGATFTALNSGPLTIGGNFNGSSDVAFAGFGTRTVTLDGSGIGNHNFALDLGDQGGSTFVVKNGSGLWLMTPTVANSYTGITTINQGALRINANALPGGLGYGYNGSTTTTENAVNTGGGNLTFNGAGSNNAVLELTAGSGDFMRPLGTGINQVQFTGNGGFGASGSDRVVNLGGSATPSTLVWGSTPSFVPVGRTFFLGSSTSSGTVTLLNPIDYNGAFRSIQVDNGTAAIDAVLEGLVSSTGTPVGFVKSGGGAVLLKHVDVSVPTLSFSATNQGRVLFANYHAIPGTSGRTVTVTAGNEVALLGVFAPEVLLSRIATTSAGALQLDASLTTPTNTAGLVVDLSAHSSLSLGAVSMNGLPAYFSGAIVPNGGTYRLGSSGFAPGGTPVTVANGGTGNAADVLILNRNRTLTGDSNRVIGANNTNGGATSILITNSNDYGGETPGATPTTLVGGAPGKDGFSSLMLANDSAVGAGNIAMATTGNDRFTYASIFGDHTLSNNVDTSLATTYFLSGYSSSEGVPISAGLGAMTFAGTVTLSTGSSSQIYGRISTAPIIFTGDIKRSAATNLQITNQAFVSFLGSKSFTTGLTLADNTSLVIDGDGSLGVAPATAANNLVLGSSADAISRPSIRLQPGSGAEALDANRKVVLTAAKSVVFRVDSGDSLAINGAIGLSAAGATNFIKQGGGQLTLGGAFTGASTTFDIRSGTLALDYANYAAGAVSAGAQIVNSNPALILGNAGVSVGDAGAGLLVVTKSGVTGVAPAFASTTLAAKPIAIGFDNTTNGGGAGTLNLGTLTRAVAGSVVAFTVPSGNSVLTSSGTNNALLTDGGGNAYATFGSTQGAIGTDWAAKASGAIVGGSSIASFYTANTASTLAGNANMSGPALTTLAAPATVASLRFGTAGAHTIDTSATAANILTTGGILVTSDVGVNLSTISGTAGPLRGTGGTIKELVVFQNNTAGDLLISAPIADNAAATVLTKAGPGKLILANNTSSFTGAVFFNKGTVEVGMIANGGSSQPLGKVSNAATSFLFNGGTLRYNSATAGTTDHGATFNSVSGIDVADAPLTLTSSSITLIGSPNMPGVLRKMGAGSLNLAGTSSNTNLSVEVLGGTVNLAKSGTANAVQQVNGASLIIDSAATAMLTGTGADQVADTSSVLVKGGGTFDLNGHNEGFDGLAGTGNGVVTSATAATLTLGTNHDVLISTNTVGAALAGVGSTGLNSFAGSITGALAVTKAGTGTQILGGSSTYSGATLINSGTLKAAGADVLPSGVGKGDLTLSNAIIGGIDAAGVFDTGGFDQKINGLNAAAGTTAYITNNLPIGVASMTSTLIVGHGDASGDYAGTLQDGFTVTTGSVSATGARGVLALTKVGTGRQTLSGANTYTGATRVSGGTLAFASVDANANALTIDDGAKVEVSATLNGEAKKVLKTASLSLNGAAIIDLTNNLLFVDFAAGASPLPEIEAAIFSGFNGGTWDGAGLNTSYAGMDVVGGLYGLTGLGASESAFARRAPDGSYQGRSVDDTSIIVRYTTTGDANLDGVVDLDDYARIDTAFNNGSSPITGIHWANGDFNYDGQLTYSDYALIDTAFKFTHDPGSNDDVIQQHTAQFGQAYTLQMEALASQAIPEPGSIAMLAVGGLMLGLRRRRAGGE